ncbi:uncharacterized protein LOC124446386 [Xenia sp. Carnegie-2017]|uniref:uncharacterized protein LOC124446386 n=1 Tax=Xenia sp. Carnegie-2017 TaxID=2897299 RepID=UPI001F04B0CB|nr:uncharacterized protein LOC124446386 [Xenia sp. Carnegie-2017]
MAECPIANTTRSNWFENHPKYQEMKSYGGEEISIRAAMIVYLDLIEVKHWFDVELHHCDAIKSVYIVGRPLKKCQIELILPVESSHSFTHSDLMKYISNICEAYSKIDLSVAHKDQTIYVAFTDSSSTIVYYKMSNGLIEPDEVGDDNAEVDCQVRWKRNSKNKRNKR